MFRYIIRGISLYGGQDITPPPPPPSLSRKPRASPVKTMYISNIKYASEQVSRYASQLSVNYIKAVLQL